MTSVYNLATPLPESEHNARIYSGELLVFRGLHSVVQLIERCRLHCFDHLGENPTRVQYSLTSDEIEQAVESLRLAVRNDDDLQAAWRQVLNEVGINLGESFGDSVVIRVQTPVSKPGAYRTQPLLAHRDTWGSNLSTQINWWAPLYETTPERTIAIFPRYFSQVVENDSADWNFQDMMAAYRSDNENYPLLPTAKKTPPFHEALAVSLLPGDLLCFSGAHLHSSVPNTTDLTRLSFETRTVNRSDMFSGLGAPNIDGNAPFQTAQIFRNLLTGQKLGELTKR